MDHCQVLASESCLCPLETKHNDTLFSKVFIDFFFPLGRLEKANENINDSRNSWPECSKLCSFQVVQVLLLDYAACWLNVGFNFSIHRQHLRELECIKNWLMLTGKTVD